MACIAVIDQTFADVLLEFNWMTSINCTAIAGSGVILIDGVPLPSRDESASSSRPSARRLAQADRTRGESGEEDSMSWERWAHGLAAYKSMCVSSLMILSIASASSGLWIKGISLDTRTLRPVLSQCDGIIAGVSFLD